MKYIRWLPEAKTGIRASVMNRNTSVRGTGYVFEPLNVKSERTFSGGMPGTNLTGRFNHGAPKGYWEVLRMSGSKRATRRAPAALRV